MSRAPRSIRKYLSEISRATVFPMDMASSKRRFILIYAVRLLFLVGRRLWKDRCPRKAAALAYQTLLSVVPLLAIILAVASTLELEPYVQKLISSLETVLLPEVAADAGTKVRALVEGLRPKTLSIFGGVSLVMISLTLLFNVEQITNEIFRCARARKLWLRTLSSLLLLTLAPLAFGMSLYYTGRFLYLPRGASAFIPFIFTVLSLFLSYWRLPHRKILIRHSLVSAVVAGAFFEGVKLAFAFYAKHLGVTLSYVYGTMAILPIFMIWIYVAWLIFLFGAELNAALHEVKRHDRFDT